MGKNNSGFLTAITALFSRLFLFLYWIGRPGTVDSIFGSVIWPCLGFFFLPFTTLMYILLYAPGVGLSAFDWVLLILAALIDLGTIGLAGFANRDKLPKS
jgi:hypothetical protein